MKTMESFLIMFYILDQCFDYFPEESLGGFLGAISPELWEDGQPVDRAILLDWEHISQPETITKQNIAKKICGFLEHYEKQFGFNFAKTKQQLCSQEADNFVVKAVKKTVEMYKRFGYLN